jgi:adenylosuccinate lyase
MDIPQCFLLTDAILKLYVNITSDMVVFPKQSARHLLAELPFMSTEKILMEGVEKGMSRQEMHEIIKEHSIAAGKNVKEEGKDNDLLTRLANDPRIPFSFSELQELLGDQQSFVGRAPEQTEEYLAEVVYPLLEKYKGEFDDYDATLTV